MSARPHTVLALLLLLGLVGCHGSLTLGGDPFRDDDDTADDDDAADDDDTADDDDSVGDDDDSDFGDAAGVFTIVGVIQHPEGRYSQAVGYFFINTQPADPAAPAPEEALPRGGDFGCEATTPDSDGRGGDFVTLDAGDYAAMWQSGSDWEYTLPQVERDGLQYYFASSQDGQPATVPPDQVLGVYVPGGSDLPEIEVDELVPTQAPFAVTRPALTAGASNLAIDPEAGLPFQWEPGNQEGLGIGVEFFDQATGRQWTIECWVEDSGSFLVEPTLLRQMPEALQGATWIRRLRGGWLEEGPANPPIYGQGALQHRWLIELGVPVIDG